MLKKYHIFISLAFKIAKWFKIESFQHQINPASVVWINFLPSVKSSHLIFHTFHRQHHLHGSYVCRWRCLLFVYIFLYAKRITKGTERRKEISREPNCPCRHITNARKPVTSHFTPYTLSLRIFSVFSVCLQRKRNLIVWLYFHSISDFRNIIYTYILPLLTTTVIIMIMIICYIYLYIYCLCQDVGVIMMLVWPLFEANERLKIM